jgi:hypothetical protein
MFTHFRAEGTEAGLDLDIEIEPDKRVYCFFGRNGVGKTVLLETLGRTLLLAHTMFAPSAPTNGTPDAARARANGRFAGRFWDVGVHERLRDLVLQAPRSIRLDDRAVKTAADRWDHASLLNWARERRAGSVDQPIVAIGAHNRGVTQNLASNRVRLLGSVQDRFVECYLRTYAAVTRREVETESLAEWLTARLAVSRTFARFDDRSFEVEKMMQLMEELDPETFHGIATRAPDGALGGIQYTDGKLRFGGTPFERLPSGWISTMKLFQEILAGYGGWTGEKDLGAVDGIVLIDEIDAHVHPTWQARILPLLKRFFPRTTFFVCTHSPLIVATTEAGEAYELVREENRVTAHQLGNPRAWYLADLCEVAFHVTPPTVDDGADVPGLLLDFSIQVKDYLGTKDPTRKAGAEALYERIIPSVPPTDPRRPSLDALKDMLR